MSLDNMFKQFKDIVEAQKFAESQYESMIKLKKENEQLKKENEALKEMLTRNPEGANITVKDDFTVETNDPQEIICKRELKKLNQLSTERQLTMEEAKKVDIYTKLLIQIKQNIKQAVRDVSEVDTTDLLRLVSSGEDE